jgi:acetyl esterase/lipase
MKRGNPCQSIRQKPKEQHPPGALRKFYPRLTPIVDAIISGSFFQMAMNLPRLPIHIAVVLLPAFTFFARGGDRNLDAIPYKQESTNEPCRLDISVPESGVDLPVVVWFHGGGFTEGTRSIPNELKNQNLVVVAPGYRLHPAVRSPVYIEDAAAAVAWVFDNIDQYRGSNKKIYLSGHSAGGYLAAMLALDKKYLAAQGIDANRLRGVVPLSGQTITHFTIRKERGMSHLHPLVDEMAPLYHVRGDAPPMLLVTGDREMELWGRYEENAMLWRMMKLAEHSATDLIEIPGKNHGEMTASGLAELLRFIQKNESSK